MAKKKKIKKAVSCYEKFGGRCEAHDRKCVIPVEFPPGDDRNRFISEMRSLGAKHTHGPDSEHRCDLCERERQEGRRSGYYQIEPKDGVVKPKAVIDRLQRERDERKKIIERNRSKAD